VNVRRKKIARRYVAQC